MRLSTVRSGMRSPTHAEDSAATIRHVAGCRVVLDCPDPALMEKLGPWLDLFVEDGMDAGEPPEFTFRVEVAARNSSAADIPGGARLLVEYVYVSAWTDGQTHWFRGTDGSRVDLDTERGQAVCVVPDAALDGPPWVLRELWNATFTTFLRRHGRHPLHAAALARDGRGLLVVGPSMSGKTSLALNLLRRGWCWVADDKVLLTGSPAGEIQAWGLFRHFNIDPALISWFQELATIRNAAPVYLHSDKRGVRPETIYGDRRLSGVRPDWILFPSVVDLGPSVVEPVGSETSFLELLRQAPLVSDRDAVSSATAVLGRLARDTPAFRISTGRDLLENPFRLTDLGEEIGIPIGPPPARI